MKSALSSLQRDLEYGFIDETVLANKLENPELITNSDSNSMYEALKNELEFADSYVFSVAFVTADGIGALKQQLIEFQGRGTIITSSYQDFNEPAALRELLTLENVDAYVMADYVHHAKGYIFSHGDHVTALVGSSNLTRYALTENQEWNIRVSSHRNGNIAMQFHDGVVKHIEKAIPLTEEWIRQYEQRRATRTIVFTETQPLEVSPEGEKILPNLMQVEALEQLQQVVDSGEKRALIISATGTGKTILAALATRQLKPMRTLFIAHREQILKKAAEEFSRVLEIDESQIGFYVGQRREVHKPLVFATIQSLSRKENLAEISPLQFDMIIIDEVHRSGAESYRSVLNHFRPQFALGLTATPERTDGFNVFELFEYNVPYEIRLEGALENRMLVPFDYYGIADYESAQGSIGDKSKLKDLTADSRVDHIADALQKYSFAEGTKGLVFCSSNEESRILAESLSTREVHGRRLRTRSLSGADTVEERETVVAQLENGELDYIFTVDIFNEGIDIPSVNVIVLLRSTESSIIFTQQLGRGLRKSAGKHSLRVIDFIGNYANNYLIAIALTGNRSGHKPKILDDVNDPRPKAGASTVSFDRVSANRILESLRKARITGVKAKRESIAELKYRLGRIPRLIDFFHHELFDPTVLCATDQYTRNYWALLHKLKEVDVAPSPDEDGFLSFIAAELLNGKRPQELLLLNELLKRGPQGKVSADEYRTALNEYSSNLDTSNTVLRSVELVLNLHWFQDTTAERYGGRPLVVRVDDIFRLGNRFAELYYSYDADHPHPATSFRSHVDDLIETGLHINRRQYARADSFVRGKTYTRKDAARLLNWQRNRESTIYGYAVDAATHTCPIFVTYHKDADVVASHRYEDTFIDQSTMQWFSRNNRTLESKELQPILNGSAELHLFVKREDADGLEFYYLGQAKATHAKERHMPGNNNDLLDVVVMNLTLDEPVAPQLFKALTANKRSSLEDSTNAEKNAELHRSPGHVVRKNAKKDSELPK